ncbi:MAG: hypothetical protein QM530_07635 [Phycisphaerales bacterium]|nr:hypothetical protein [Phycisphaerales bacterium]
MKPKILLWSLLLLVLANNSFAQSQKDTAASELPYLKYKSLPAFPIRMLDSHSIFNTFNISKGEATVFIMFSPDCDHCEQLSKMITDSITAFDKVNLYLLSPMPLYQIKLFALKNGLTKYRQIMVGQDFSYFMISFFKASTVPFIVVYDKEKQYITTIKRLRKISELIEVVKNIRG